MEKFHKLLRPSGALFWERTASGLHRDVQAKAAELWRSIEGGGAVGVILPPALMTPADVLELCRRHAHPEKTAEPALEQIGRSSAFEAGLQ